MTLDANEWTDAVTGIRRIGEVAVFGLADMVRSLDASNPESVKKVLKTPAGQYLASFFVPLRTLDDIYGAFDKETRIQRDVRGQELTGPARANIPSVVVPKGLEPALSAEGLPARMSMYNGEPQTSSFGVERQLTGISRQVLGPMKQLIEETPKLKEGDLTPRIAGAEANNAVVAQMGKYLQMKTKSGKVLEDVLVNHIRTAGTTPDKRRELIQQTFAELRKEAVDGAINNAVANKHKTIIKELIDYQIDETLPVSERENARVKVYEKLREKGLM
jgi:hypothetical protein